MNAAYDVGMTDEELTEAISLRITTEDRALLDALAARLPMKALSIARVALRLGLKELTVNPTALFVTRENLEEVVAARARGETVTGPRLAGAAAATLLPTKKKKK
jgi:hypothetical protein